MPKGIYKRGNKRRFKDTTKMPSAPLNRTRKPRKWMRKVASGAASLVPHENGGFKLIPIADVKVSDLPRLVSQGAMVVSHDAAKELIDED